MYNLINNIYLNHNKFILNLINLIPIIIKMEIKLNKLNYSLYK